MLVPCEIMTKRIIPAIRVNVTKQLYNKHNLSQVEIASRLGITQAAVSKYLSGKYSKEIKKLESKKFMKEISLNLSDSLAKKKDARIKFTKEFCRCCKFLDKKVKCKIFEAS